MTIYLNSYRPLIRYPEGREAIIRYGLPPFLDYSCRKEPDFQSAYPSISALCRVEKFAPRLHEGDLVVYITCKGKYLESKQPHWRLTAILKVLKRFETHAEAAAWYVDQGLALPRNCMVAGNPPCPIEMTAPITEFATDLRRWDLAYQKRARQCGVFLVCKSQFMDLCTPPILTEESMQGLSIESQEHKIHPQFPLKSLENSKRYAGSEHCLCASRKTIRMDTESGSPSF